MARQHSLAAFWQNLCLWAEQSGRTRLALLREWLQLRLGPPRLAWSEYGAMRLFDTGHDGSGPKDRYVGFRVSEKIWLTTNFRTDLFGLVNNKFASDLLFAAHGFPVLQTKVIFREGAGHANPFLLTSERQLADYLSADEHFPLFCKPLSGHQSLGSASFEYYDPEQRCLITTAGLPLSIEAFLGYMRPHAKGGYLLQQRAQPHPEVQRLCGNRLATMRLLTAAGPSHTQILRACWKIPTGINTADNFWREGNLLGQVDLATGTVVRVLRRRDVGFDTVTHHPDSQAPLVGMAVPLWPQIKQLALDASRVIEDLPLVGWDIAPTSQGPVIVELNETPDFRLHQLADGRGILDDDLCQFINQRRLDAKGWRDKARQHRRSL